MAPRTVSCALSLVPNSMYGVSAVIIVSVPRQDLCGKQGAVSALRPQQRIGRARLDDLPVLEHDDPVGAPDRREPMRDEQDRPLSGEALDGLLDQLLGFAVHG